MTFSRKLTSLVAVAMLAGFTLSACGGSDDPADDKAGTKPATSGTTITQANFAEVIGDSQAKAKSAHVDMTIGVGGQEIEAEGDVAVGKTIADSAMTMTMDMGSSMKLDMRLVDETMYMNMGAMTENKFLKIDLNDQSNPFAKQYGQIMDQMDPTKQMEQFKDAVTSFEKKGEPQTIDGVEAQPYVVTVDTTKNAAFKDLPEASKSQVPDTIVYTMYVGSDDLLRRMEFEIAGSKSTMNYSKWGEPVDIKAPPADQISDKDLSQLGGIPTPAA